MEIFEVVVEMLLSQRIVFVVGSGRLGTEWTASASRSASFIAEDSAGRRECI